MPSLARGGVGGLHVRLHVATGNSVFPMTAEHEGACWRTARRSRPRLTEGKLPGSSSRRIANGTRPAVQVPSGPWGLESPEARAAAGPFSAGGGAEGGTFQRHSCPWKRQVVSEKQLAPLSMVAVGLEPTTSRM